MQNIGPRAADVRAALKSTHQRVIQQIDVIRNDNPVAPPLVAVAGSTVFDYTANIRTSGDIELIDPTGELTPNLAMDLISPFTADLSIKRGLQLDDGTQMLQRLGMMRLTQIKVAEKAGAVTITARLYDKGARCQSPMPRPWIINVGTLLQDAIPPLLLEQLPTLTFQMAQTQFQLASLHLDPKSLPWDESVKLATSGGCLLYPDRDGKIILTPAAQATSQAFVWEYVEGATADFVDPERTIDADDVPNVVVVVGTNPAAPGIRAEAWDNDPSSPTYRYGPYGERTKFVEEPRLASQAQAQAMANALIAEVMGPGETIEFDAAPNPWLDVGDAIGVTRDAIGLDGKRMIVQRIDMPWYVGDLMHVTARRSVLLADDPTNTAPIIIINPPPGPPPVTPTPHPNLLVQSISMSPPTPSLNDQVAFSATILNDGTADVPAGVVIGVSFQVDGLPVTFDHTFTGGLAEATTVVLTATAGSNVGRWSATAGPHIVTAIADDQGLINELAETDNTLDLPFTVSGTSTPRPDLVVQSISWTPLNPVPGDHVIFSAVIKNQGAATYDGSVNGPLEVDFLVDGNLVALSATFTGTIAPNGTTTITAAANNTVVSVRQHSTATTASA